MWARAPCRGPACGHPLPRGCPPCSQAGSASTSKKFSKTVSAFTHSVQATRHRPSRPLWTSLLWASLSQSGCPRCHLARLLGCTRLSLKLRELSRLPSAGPLLQEKGRSSSSARKSQLNIQGDHSWALLVTRRNAAHRGLGHPVTRTAFHPRSSFPAHAAQSPRLCLSPSSAAPPTFQVS